MTDWIIALLLRSFFAAVLLCLLHVVRVIIDRHLPESKLKRALLLPVFKRNKPRDR